MKQAAFVLSEKIETSNFKIFENGEIRIYDTKVYAQELSKVFALGKKAESLEDYFLKITT